MEDNLSTLYRLTNGRIGGRFYAGYEHKTSRQIPLVVLTPERRLNMT